MMSPISLVLAVALSASAPPVEVVIGDLGMPRFVLRDVHVEHGSDQGPMLRGWLCRSAPGASLRRLSVVAETDDGRPVWRSDIAAPRFDPGRRRQCRALRIDLPPEVASRTVKWTLLRPRQD